MRDSDAISRWGTLVTCGLLLWGCAASGATPGAQQGRVLPAMGGARAIGPSAFPKTLIYSSNYDANTVTEYGAFSNGDVRPVRMIAGPHTKMDRPIAIAVDASGYVYVDDFSYTHPHISVFAPAADGDARPARTITATSYGGIHAFGMCVDAQGYLYVADTYQRTIRVFAPGADGDVAPVRTVLDRNIVSPFGVFVDGTGHLWVTDSFEGAILEFPPNANGPMRSSRRISGPATHLQTPVALSISPDGSIFVGDINANEVFVFSKDASGNVAPLRWFSAYLPSTPAYGMVYRDGQVYLALQHGQPQEYGIGAFKADSNGPTTPLREISGPDTGLQAEGIAIH